MITVRFPNGTSVQYNTASFVERHSEYSDLLVAKGGSWVAQVPNSAVIEIQPACRVYDATAAYRDQRLDSLEKEMRSLKRVVAKALKRP